MLLEGSSSLQQYIERVAELSRESEPGAVLDISGGFEHHSNRNGISGIDLVLVGGLVSLHKRVLKS